MNFAYMAGRLEPSLKTVSGRAWPFAWPFECPLERPFEMTGAVAGGGTDGLRVGASSWEGRISATEGMFVVSDVEARKEEMLNARMRFMGCEEEALYSCLRERRIWQAVHLAG